MYSFMGGGLFCASVANILLVVSAVTDYWMQYRLAGTFAHQGLWRYCWSGKCYVQMESIAYWNAIRAFMILSALACFAGIITGILSFAQFSTFQRFNRAFAAGILFFASTLFVLLAMGIYTGITVNFLGKRLGDWRFSWSYILGWVALLMTSFADPDVAFTVWFFPLAARCQSSAGNHKSSLDRSSRSYSDSLPAGLLSHSTTSVTWVSSTATPSATTRQPDSSTSLPELDSSGFTLPLQISSGVCSAASMLLLLTSLCTSSWMMEKSSDIRSGLWVIYRGPECTLYEFRALATFIHVTRGLLVTATFLGILSLACICLSIQRTYLGRMSLIITAATLSFGAGLVTMISMSVFTASYRYSDENIQELTSYGSSYHLGWTSCAMYFLTGWLILLTKSTTFS